MSPRPKDRKAADEMHSLASELFLPYQLAWLHDKSRFKIFEKSRRIGGTWVQSFEDVLDCITTPKTKVYFSSADLTAAGEYGDYVDEWAAKFNAAASCIALLDDEARKIPDMVFADEEKDLKVQVKEFSNGSRIYLLSSNPKAFRSKGGKIVWDEAAWHEQDAKMWAAASPAAMWGFAIRILSTHNGPNSVFNQLAIKARKQAEGSEKVTSPWSVHTVTIMDAASQGLVSKIKRRPVTNKEIADWINEERAKCLTESQWQQEYMCAPQDESTTLISYAAITAQERKDILRELSECRGPLWVGYDVARKRHFSVVYVLEGGSPSLTVRKVLTMERLKFSKQKELLWPILRLPQVQRACIDATGLGMQIAEEAVDDFGRYKVEGLDFTAALKENLALGLLREFDDGNLFIPGDLPQDEQVQQTEGIHSLRKFVTAANHARYDAKASEAAGHADHFWALALAMHAARDATSGPARITSSSSARRAAKTESVVARFSGGPDRASLDQWSRFK